MTLAQQIKRRVTHIGQSIGGYPLLRCECGETSDDLDDAAKHKPGCAVVPLIERVYETYCTHLAAVVIGY